MKCSFYLDVEDKEHCEHCLDREHCEIILHEEIPEEQELE